MQSQSCQQIHGYNDNFDLEASHVVPALLGNFLRQNLIIQKLNVGELESH